jgi:hypothetical protein
VQQPLVFPGVWNRGSCGERCHRWRPRATTHANLPEPCSNEGSDGVKTHLDNRLDDTVELYYVKLKFVVLDGMLSNFDDDGDEVST